MFINMQNLKNVMRKREIKLMLLSLIAFLFVFSSIAFVFAAESWQNIMAGSFSDFFTSSGWESGNIPSNVAKIFFFVIIGLVIFLILNPIFGGKHTGIMLILSGAISFLATAYITPDEIYSILISYTALGLTITTLIPIAILLGLSFRAATASEGQTILILLQWVAWILFSIYSIYRFIFDWLYGKEGSSLMNWIIIATAAISLIMVIANKSVLKLVMKEEIAAEKIAAKRKVEDALTTVEVLSGAERRLAGKDK
jgi:hypothetical protein